MHIPHLTAWDWVLVVVVTFQATLFTYVRHPVWKAFLLSLPIPFTLAVLALGHPIDVTNVAGFGLLLGFYHVVRIAYRIWRWPIVCAILLALCVYLATAYCLSTLLPRDSTAFWIVAGIVFGAAWLQVALYPRQDEPGYRTPLPVWLKMPAIAVVTIGVVLAKGAMQGFITSFPMVGLIAAYEGRFVLGTVCRQMPILVLMMFPMMLVVLALQSQLGYSRALIPAWLIFLAIIIPVTLKQRSQYTLGEPHTDAT